MQTQTFRGNFLISLYGVFLIIMVVMFCLFSYDLWTGRRDLPFAGWMLFVALVWYLILGSGLFYFRLSSDHLEIKSHVFPGFRKKYLLEDISRVLFERATAKTPKGLRIKMKTGSRSLNFFAGSLRRRHWEALAQALVERGIPVDYTPGW